MRRLTVFVPEVVLQETVNKWRERYEEGLRRLNDFRRLDPDLDLAIPQDATAAAADYERRLKDVLEAAGARVMGFPSVSHAEVVERALSRQKPFDAKGQRGYRDALIWHSVLELLPGQDLGIAVALVSENTSDFADSGATTLAGSLTQEAVDKSPMSTIELHPGLRSFVQQHIEPAEEARRELNDRLQRDPSFTELLAHKLMEASFAGPDRFEPDIRLPSLSVPFQDLTFDDLVDLPTDIQVLDAWQLADDQILVTLGANGDAGLVADVEADDLRSLPDTVRSAVISEDEITSKVLVYEPVWMAFEALYRPSVKELEQVEFARLAVR